LLVASVGLKQLDAVASVEKTTPPMIDCIRPPTWPDKS